MAWKMKIQHWLAPSLRVRSTRCSVICQCPATGAVLTWCHFAFRSDVTKATADCQQAAARTAGAADRRAAEACIWTALPGRPFPDDVSACAIAGSGSRSCRPAYRSCVMYRPSRSVQQNLHAYPVGSASPIWACFGPLSRGSLLSSFALMIAMFV